MAENAAAASVGGCQGLYEEARERLLQAIDRSSVTVHALNPRGLDTGQVGADAFRGDAREPASARLVREGNLKTLPEYTGGRTIVNVNQPERFVPAIFEESRVYYVLAVERGPAHRNGQPHDVRIEVDRPGASVLSRSTYLEASASPTTKKPSTDPLERALAELLPSGTVPLRMTLAPGTAKNASLDVTLKTPLAAPARADVLVGVFDQFSREVGSERARVDLTVRDGGDVQWTLHLNPKPGHYEVRAAVRIADAIGAVVGYIDVSKAADRAGPAPTSAPHDVATPAGRSAVRPAALDAVLAQAGNYVEQYGSRGGLLLDELYRQDVQSSRLGTRTLKSQLLILPDAREGWVQFRDVLSVDGKTVADREDRLARLFAAPADDPRGQARRIAEEGARYNLTGANVVITRSLNQPLAALLYLRAVNQPRSRFDVREKDGDGQHLSFTEQQQPALIGTTGNGGATGDFWIDPETGRARRAVVHVVSRASNVTVTGTLRVRYEADTKTGLMLPVEMDERYEARDPRGNLLDVITGTARYSNPRQFNVTVDK